VSSKKYFRGITPDSPSKMDTAARKNWAGWTPGTIKWGTEMDRRIGLKIRKSAAAKTRESRKTGLAKTADPVAHWSSSWGLYRGYLGML
jgi:hypothetical protein